MALVVDVEANGKRSVMQIPDMMRAVHAGWHPLLTQLHTDLTAIDPGYEVGDVKEKFGELRVYLHTYAPGAEELIDAAEDKSRTVCEYCGKPGRPRGNDWIKTMCDMCGSGV